MKVFKMSRCAFYVTGALMIVGHASIAHAQLAGPPSIAPAPTEFTLSSGNPVTTSATSPTVNIPATVSPGTTTMPQAATGALTGGNIIPPAGMVAPSTSGTGLTGMNGIMSGTGTAVPPGAPIGMGRKNADGRKVNYKLSNEYKSETGDSDAMPVPPRTFNID